MPDAQTDRRSFLRFIAASPLLHPRYATAQHPPPKTIQDALNMMDFEAAARQAIPPAHFGYLATGVDDDATLHENVEAFHRIQLRARRLIDVSATNISVELLGTRWETPIILSPVASQKAFHSEGEIAVARAAASKHHLQILSTVTTSSLEDVLRAARHGVWYQLYPTPKWENTERLTRRAEQAGSPVLVLTVDLPAGRNTETERRSIAKDTRPCAACHDTTTPGASYRRKPMFDGIDMSGPGGVYSPRLTWDSVDRLKRFTKMKIVLKGIVSREDAVLSREHGVDAIIVSNHGGRAEESRRASIDCLPEVVDGAGPQLPVLVDGGIRRGTDVFKALALGARAVCIGRPYVWGLGAFGQPGVERVLEILRGELILAMKQFGARSLAEVNRGFLVAR